MEAFIKKPVKLTREELFERVWQKPMARLAAELGISGNGLAKICDRLEVPYPSRGYWAKKSAGKAVVTRRLAPAKASTSASVVVTPTEKLELNIPTIWSDGESKPARLVEVEVSDHLTKPHPVIAKWHATHERERREYLDAKAKDAKAKIRNPWDYPSYGKVVPAYTETDRREHRIMDALFKAAEKAGGKIDVNEKGQAHFVFDGQKIEYRISRHAAKASAQIAEVADGRGKSEKAIEESELQISIVTNIVTGARRTWKDSPRHRLESLLREFLQTMILAGPILAERQRKWDEERRQWAEQQRLREERERLEKLESNRWLRLRKLAEQWEDCNTMRRFLDALERADKAVTDVPPDESTIKWLEWARLQLNKRDPTGLGAKAIFDHVAKATEWERVD